MSATYGLQKRIIDLILSVLFSAGFCLVAGPKTLPIEGYNRTFFTTKTLGASATGTFKISQPVSRWSMRIDKSCAFTFQTGLTGAYTTASGTASQWFQFVGSTTLELMPQDIASGSSIFFKNGTGAQTIRFYSFGN